MWSQAFSSTITDKKAKVEEKFDVIVIGTGISGLFTALNIDSNWQVLLVTKDSIKKNNSSLAQGGIATSRDIKTHFEDTLKAGTNHNNVEAVRILTKESCKVIKKLMDYGVSFDTDEKGNLIYTREGGHNQRNVLHVKDETGRHIINTLVDEVRRRSNIKVLENLFIKDIITHNQRVDGVIAINQENNLEVYKSKAMVIATGGIGGLYQYTTNETGSNGDGIAIAYRAGAMLKDMEFIQFHPTAFYHQDRIEQCFLISEAVRGEGGILRNKLGEAFMDKYHEMKDLAPRDIVAQAIVNEINNTDHPCVYLDITHKDDKYIKKRFPMIYNRCLALGLDITKDWIPVAPAEHYIMGGISTDLKGRTTIDGLYACGECGYTGVHGSNRLASNSLLEGIVFGSRVALDLNKNLATNFSGYSCEPRENEDFFLRRKAEIDYCVVDYNKFNNENRPINEDKPINENKPIKFNKDVDINLLNMIQRLKSLEEILKTTMNRYVGVIRNKSGLIKALKIVSDIKIELEEMQYVSKQYYQLLNMATVAYEIINAAYNRKSSIGAHYITDKIGGN
ncbi:L-aspartate oxidase [Alkaliphilus transvaalensis]|uniref:L-aspartate oxidase n=1 Tax=Alkaliphilus transvaalensis TaxID=114628 RepID=UPI0006858E20|nr:L-aspartate oxidase [Alkaliphilus transvaalensis]